MILTLKEMFEQLLKEKGLDGVDCSGWNWSGIDVTGVDFTGAKNIDDSIYDAIDMNELDEIKVGVEDDVEDDVEVGVKNDVEEDDEEEIEDIDESSDEEEIDVSDDKEEVDEVSNEEEEKDIKMEIRSRMMERRNRMSGFRESRKSQALRRLYEQVQELDEEVEKEEPEKLSDKQVRSLLIKAFNPFLKGSIKEARIVINESEELQPACPEVVGVLEFSNKLLDGKDHVLVKDGDVSVILKGEEDGNCDVTIKLLDKDMFKAEKINFLQIMNDKLNKIKDTQQGKKEIKEVWQEFIEEIIENGESI